MATEPKAAVPTCDHGVVFDEVWAKRENPTSYEVRRRFPRLDGVCPKGCGYEGIAYTSMAHYVYGDW